MSKGRSGRAWRELAAMARRVYPNVCHLCGNPIDLTLHHRDPMSYTLDHVTPLAVDSNLAETLENLRPAHRRCNSSKGKGEFKKAKFSSKWN